MEQEKVDTKLRKIRQQKFGNSKLINLADMQCPYSKGPELVKHQQRVGIDTYPGH